MEDLLPTLRLKNIRVSVVSLSPEIFALKNLCVETGGRFEVAMSHTHFEELLRSHLSAPEIQGKDVAPQMVRMGFPRLLEIEAKKPEACACHFQVRNSLYVCPQCHGRSCGLPSRCKICDLPLVSASVLARAFRSVVPLAPFLPVDLGALSTRCKGCQQTFSSAHMRFAAMRLTATLLSGRILHEETLDDWFELLDCLSAISSKLGCQRQDLAMLPAAEFFPERSRLELLVLVSPPSSSESRLLQEACRNSRMDVVANLLRCRQDPNVGGKRTPLMIASAKGDLQICRLLLMASAKIDCATPSGATALHYAAFGGSYSVVELLLRAKAAASSGARMEPIQIVVENADLDIALLLMKYGADVGQISDGTAKDRLLAGAGCRTP
ncbi:unnamed protein product [Cladocopium goreaui]|uniref:General transcription factor IIH subunit 2 n=1 Tax=Cladocopium goreaui TaxID=2562237 RepID=A0A9P1CRG0_9DINO|nr:unnamed protein product [Cladocopium goreaui]